jgi:conjugative transfer region lipoprotein (TIGR03751 family)
MRRILIKQGLSTILLLLAPTILLFGCATSKDELLPHGDQTLLDVWNQEAGGSAGSQVSRRLLDARLSLRRPLTGDEARAGDARGQRGLYPYRGQ